MTGKYDHSKALVLGAGVSGEAAALLLLARGGQVVLIDAGQAEAQSACAQRVRQAGGRVELNCAQVPDEAFDLCVVSPAFAMGHAWLENCRGRGIPIISEMSLGACYWPAKILAITGSKGKSSLVKLCADTLNQAGFPALAAGNYGTPLCSLVLKHPNLRWAVVEVSSFQMEHTEGFKPDIAILLNLQADHLDRHVDMAEYKALKLKLFSAMQPGSVALIPDKFDEQGQISPKVVKIRFGADAQSCEWFYQEHAISGIFAGAPGRICISGTWFDNPILGLAAVAGAAALHYAGCDNAQIADGIAAFQPLAHRVQYIGESRVGVAYVDDSKATSLAALAAGIQMVRKPVRLIAGGLLKENNLEDVKELLVQTTKKVYLIGQCSGQMLHAWQSAIPCEVCETLECAVAKAVKEACAGDTVLLSPGTASFDQFKSYRERGERFTALVRKVADL